jgi:hypothetical protein
MTTTHTLSSQLGFMWVFHGLINFQPYVTQKKFEIQFNFTKYQ